MLSDLIEGSLATLADLAREHHKAVWEVGFSGGKDSTLLLHLLVEFLEDRVGKPGARLPKAIYVVYEDTLLELPPIRRYAHKVLADLAAYSRELLGGLVKTVIVRPSEGEDFFSMMIDRGYPAPHYRFRWCVRVLKVKPMRSFLSELSARGKVVMLTGIRADESYFRSRVVRRRASRRGRWLLKVAPLLAWREEQVFAFLRQAKQPWNSHDYSLLLRIYGQLGREEGGRGVRYGCWACTVVRREKALYRLEEAGLCPRAHVLAEAKEALRSISRQDGLRIKRQGKWRLGRLNEKGRLAVASVLAYVLAKAPEGLSAYLEWPELRARLARWLRWLVERGDGVGDGLLADAHLAREALTLLEPDLNGSPRGSIIKRICSFVTRGL